MPRPLVLLARTLLTILLILALALTSSRARAAAPGPNDGLAAEPSLDRGTPRRAFEGFLRAGGSGDALRAAHYLDLRPLPAAQQAAKAPALAQQVWYVTTHIGRFDLSKISDAPDASIPKGESALIVGSLDDRDGPVPIAMERVTFPDGVERWIFARSTVAIAPSLYASLARPEWAAQLPAWMNVELVGNAVWQWIGVATAIPLAWVSAWLVVLALAGVLELVARRTATRADDVLVARLRRPMRLAAGAILYRVLTGQLQLTELATDAIRHVTFTMLVVAGSWAMLRALDAMAAWREEQLPRTDGPEAVAQRRASHTRAALFERLAAMGVTFVGVGLGLLQFEVVRGVGESLLASAGLAGVVLGFAAQRSLGAIIGGVQLSMAQPVRLGDEVFLDGEYGRIDHIYLTHVVVRRWDDRRIVFPVARFLEQSFQNLSKFGSEQTGEVTLTCDARSSLDSLRAQLRTICESTPLWDGRVCALQVSNAAASALTLRALVSAATAPACEELRSLVRERMTSLLHEARGSVSEDAPAGSERRPSVTRVG